MNIPYRLLIICATIVLLALVAMGTVLATTGHDSSFIRYAGLFGGLFLNILALFGVQLRVAKVSRQIHSNTRDIQGVSDKIDRNGNGNGHDKD